MGHAQLLQKSEGTELRGDIIEQRVVGQVPVHVKPHILALRDHTQRANGLVPLSATFHC